MKSRRKFTDVAGVIEAKAVWEAMRKRIHTGAGCMCCLLSCLCSVASFAQYNVQGQYFYKKAYTREVMPTFASVSGKLPEPIMEEHPLWIKTYIQPFRVRRTSFLR
ncbi:MAG: hypothetical protein LBC19_12845 [Tannerella sp.]|nr:hypothetical protein [Tannerella sp.]